MSERHVNIVTFGIMVTIASGLTIAAYFTVPQRDWGMLAIVVGTSLAICIGALFAGCGLNKLFHWLLKI